MVGGVGGTGGPSPIPPGALGEGTSIPAPPIPGFDGGSIPDYLVLGSQQTIEIPEGEITLIQWIETIKRFIQELKEELENAEYIDDAIYALLRGDAAGVSASLIAESENLANLIGGWNVDLDEIRDILEPSYGGYVFAINQFNGSMNGIVASDAAQVNIVNGGIQAWNDIDNWAIANGFATPVFTGNPPVFSHWNVNRTAAYNWLFNNIFTPYNNYVSFGRPTGGAQGLLNNVATARNNYASEIGNANTRIAAINAQRAVEGLPPLIPESLTAPDPINTNLNNYLGYSLNLIFPVINQTVPLVPVPNTANINTITIDPAQAPPERAKYEEDMQQVVATSLRLTGFINRLATSIDLAEFWRDLINFEFREYGLNIVLPSFAALAPEKDAPEDAASAGGAGGLGLASFSIGLQSRNLEIALSNSLFSEIISRSTMPIGSEGFDLTQFSILELVGKSSVLGSIAGVGLIASSIGLLGTSSSAVQVAAGIALLEGLQGVIGSGSIESLINASLQRQVQAARTSGNEELAQGLGSLSVGELASVSQKLVAAAKISVIGLALANLGRKLGIPDLVAQLFGQAEGVSNLDVLTALLGGATIGDVLENPISGLFITESLVATLVDRLNINPENAQGIVKDLLNTLIAEGEGLGFEGLQSLAVEQLQLAGFELFDANLLANEVVSLIRGEVGVLPLSVKFGLRTDPSLIAKGIVNFFNGQDIGLVGVLLNSARIKVERMAEVVAEAGDDAALKFEIIMRDIIRDVIRDRQFKSQRDFRDALRNAFIASGFERNVSLFLSNSVATFGLNGSNISIFGVSAARLRAIDEATENRLIVDSDIRREEARDIVAEARREANRRGPVSSEDEQRIILQEEIKKVTSRRGIDVRDDAVTRAIADLADPGVILPLPELFTKVSKAVLELVVPEVGQRVAEEIRDKVLVSVFGTASIDEVDKEERREPLSLLNQVKDAVSKIIEEEEEELLRESVRQLIDLLRTLLIPNATVGFTIQSLTDHPSTFIGSLLVAKPKGEVLDIPV